jgi:hypothetical protein
MKRREDIKRLLGKGKEKSVELRQPNGTAALHGWRGWMGGIQIPPLYIQGGQKEKDLGTFF